MARENKKECCLSSCVYRLWLWRRVPSDNIQGLANVLTRLCSKISSLKRWDTFFFCLEHVEVCTSLEYLRANAVFCLAVSFLFRGGGGGGGKPFCELKHATSSPPLSRLLPSLALYLPTPPPSPSPSFSFFDSYAQTRHAHADIRSLMLSTLIHGIHPSFTPLHPHTHVHTRTLARVHGTHTKTRYTHTYTQHT